MGIHRFVREYVWEQQHLMAIQSTRTAISREEIALSVNEFGW